MPAEVTAPSLLRQLGQLAAPTASSPSNKGSKLKRQRVGDGGAAGFLRELGQLITKISATGVTVEELAPPLRLVVALATLSNVSSWWPASSAQTFEGPLDAARRLLSALLPVTGPLDFFDHTAVLLGAFGQLGAFRAEAMHWLVLAHEALGCWLQQCAVVLQLASPMEVCARPELRLSARLLWHSPAAKVLQDRADAAFEAGMSVGASDADRRLALVQAARLARAVNATGGAAQRWLAEGCLHVDSSCWRAVLLLVAHLPLLEWGQVKPALDGASRFAQELHAIAPRGEDQQISCMLFVVLGELLEHWLTTLRVRGTIQPGRCVPISEGDLLWSSGSELETLRTLVAWVDLQAQLALQAAPRSTALHLAVMGFFAKVGRLHTHCSVPFMVVPSYPVAQRCLLHSCPLVVSRLCGLLADYRKEIEGLKATYASSPLPRNARAGANGLQDIPRFNSFVLDACNALWRNRAFVECPSDAAPNTAAQVDEQLSCLRLPKTTLTQLHAALEAVLVPQEGEAPSDDQVSWGHGGRTTFELRRTLSITHGAAWQGHVRTFLNSGAVAAHVDDRAAANGSPTSVPKRPTVHALENPNLKAQYLDELRREGYVGLYDFLHAFISSLARRQQRQGMQQAA